ncbi:MAG TPA: ABC transporter substrate-binding protein [Vicinamibacterales bacterium]
MSIVPAVTEMLFAIGAGPRVIAVGSFDKWPPEVGKLTKVGALLDPDVERIIGLRPDLVVVYGTQSDLQAQLDRAGIRTFSYVLGGLGNVTATIRRLGNAVGGRARAEEVATAIESRLEAIRRAVVGKARPRTLLVFGREPGALRGIDASGGPGFLSDLVELGGGDNVLADQKRESLRASTETILAASPDLIIELHYGQGLTPDQLARERLVWNELPAIPAVRSGRVVLLMGDQFVIPGPRVVDAAEEIARAIAAPSATSSSGRGR